MYIIIPKDRKHHHRCRYILIHFEENIVSPLMMSEYLCPLFHGHQPITNERCFFMAEKLRGGLVRVQTSTKRTAHHFKNVFPCKHFKTYHTIMFTVL